MAGYGLSPYGLGPYGFGASATLSVVGALAITERTVRVTLSTPVRAVNAAMPGDALNPNTWTVTRLDTDESLIVLSVDDVDGSGTVFELYTLIKFAPAQIMHEVGTETLLTPSGSVIMDPKSFIFAGCLKLVPAVAPSEIVDLRNPPFSGGDAVAGTLIVSDGGDYEVESGANLLRKLIIRRLTTGLGEFFYMPSYGIGIRLKQPLPTADLPKLKAAIRLQVLEEPEVASVTVGLTLETNGILTIIINAILAVTNQQVSATIPVPVG